VRRYRIANRDAIKIAKELRGSYCRSAATVRGANMIWGLLLFAAIACIMIGNAYSDPVDRWSFGQLIIVLLVIAAIVFTVKACAGLMG
jgi:hypothetical protein